MNEMIKSDHKKWAEIIFKFYVERTLKKTFKHFRIVNDIPNIPLDKSLIITPNHFSWWDGFFIYLMSKKFIDRKLHIMMLESSLKKYWFFKKVGAYSINPDSASSIIQTFKYSRQIIDDKKNFIVTYPQGKIEDFETRPLSVRSGLQNLVKPLILQTVILPVAFKIQYSNERKPEIFCRFGEIIESKKIVTDYNFYANEFTKNAEQLSEDAVNSVFTSSIF
jgi:hypothetical protein